MNTFCTVKDKKTTYEEGLKHNHQMAGELLTLSPATEDLVGTTVYTAPDTARANESRASATVYIPHTH